MEAEEGLRDRCRSGDSGASPSPIAVCPEHSRSCCHSALARVSHLERPVASWGWAFPRNGVAAINYCDIRYVSYAQASSAPRDWNRLRTFTFDACLLHHDSSPRRSVLFIRKQQSGCRNCGEVFFCLTFLGGYVMKRTAALMTAVILLGVFAYGDQPGPHHKYLEQVEWILGNWDMKGEFSDGTPFVGQESSEWCLNKNFIRSDGWFSDYEGQRVDYHITTGWDPATEKLVAWFSFGDGSHSRRVGTYDPATQSWVSHEEGVDGQGRAIACDVTLQFVNQDSWNWKGRKFRVGSPNILAYVYASAQLQTQLPGTATWGKSLHVRRVQRCVSDPAVTHLQADIAARADG